MAKVLVVEDEEHLLTAIAYVLRKAGYAVATASSGPEAVAVFQNTQPDVLLVDMLLPGFDGLEVCRRISRLACVPILAMSATLELCDPLALQGAGAADAIAKPFRMQELLERVGLLLQAV